MMLMLLTASISTEAATPENAVDFTWLFVKMLLVLVIVCVSAIIFLKYILPRLGIARGNHRGRYFKVHGRYQLEPRKSLYVVEVGGRYLVIGSADHGINLITELSPEEAMGDRGKKAQ
jgi:flagellar biosynthetic protein FliO